MRNCCWKWQTRKTQSAVSVVGRQLPAIGHQRIFMDITDWRKKIDEIDQRLVSILNERAQAAQEIGRLKRQSDLPIYEPDRERIVLTQVQEQNRGPLQHRHLIQIYERIMDVMRNIQKDEMVEEAKRKK
jgi:chorismate mutase